MKNIFIIIISIFICCQTTGNVIQNQKFDNTDGFYIPVGNDIIRHSHFILDYNEEHEQANWVAYYLEKTEIYGTVKRSNNFRADIDVVTGSAGLADYKGSGYDRGHLAPAADMAFSEMAMSESFLLSNMSPQYPSLNRGQWRVLETRVRKWADEKDGVYVIVGPVFKDNIESIGSNRVTVPGYYFKIVYNPESEHVIAFLVPNIKVSDIFEYTISIDDLENFTGIDFLSQLDDGLEDEIESKVEEFNWDF